MKTAPCYLRNAIAIVALAVLGHAWADPVGTPKLVVLDRNGDTVMPVGQTKVFSWGWNRQAQADVPQNLTDVVSVAAGWNHSVALKADGTVVAWGDNKLGQTAVPAGLSGVTSIAAYCYCTVAVKQDGTVVTWGHNYQKPPIDTSKLTNVTAVSAGVYHIMALKRDGTVAVVGSNTYGEASVPKGLSDVIAIGAGAYNSYALKRDGTIVVWGLTYDGFFTEQVSAIRDVASISVSGLSGAALKKDGTIVTWGDDGGGDSKIPAGLTGVTSISNGDFQLDALKSDGTLVSWGNNFYGALNIPVGLANVTAVATSPYHTVVLGAIPPHLGTVVTGSSILTRFELKNAGTSTMNVLKTEMTGPDADQFSLTSNLPRGMGIGRRAELEIAFHPTRVGPMNAVLKIYSDDPGSPFAMPLKGFGSFNVNASKPSAIAKPFTAGPLVADRLTGMLVQKVTFTNTYDYDLDGLRVVVSKLPPDVQLYSSSDGGIPGTVEVLYTNTIPAKVSATFSLVYSDPRRRTGLNPLVSVQALAPRVLRPGPVNQLAPVDIPIVRDTPQGPLLQWNTTPYGQYVVEYSDDEGVIWHSAVHVLGATSSKMFWIDRGQPETPFKPASKAARMYQIKKL